jgi:hypothetical protein
MNLLLFGQTLNVRKPRITSLVLFQYTWFFSLKNRKIMAEARLIFDGSEGENDKFFGFDLKKY